MKALKTVIARIDASLNMFWLGIVLRGYHQVQADRFGRKAGRLARTCIARPNFDAARHQAARHKLEAELIVAKL